MAEINTTQGAKLVAKTKVLPHEMHGRKRVLCAKMPAVFAAPAVNDTILLGRIPAGSRILGTGILSCAVGTATGTLDIGLRETTTGTVLSATGIATGVDVATAGIKNLNTGAYIAAGAEYVTLVECDVYATVKVAVLLANQALKVELHYVTD
jgi:hypothetical protein